MKLFWSIHFVHPPQDIGYLVKLLDLIDSDNEAALIISENKDIVDLEGFTNNSPAIKGFSDPTHVNANGMPNRILLDTDSWGFPNCAEIERVENLVKKYYSSSLYCADHYLFGQASQDCVARMGSALIFGSGQSYCTDGASFEEIKAQNYPALGALIRPIEHVSFIEELCYPNKHHCFPNGRLSADYCDFVRVYDTLGRLHRKEFISLGSIFC